METVTVIQMVLNQTFSLIEYKFKSYYLLASTPTVNDTHSSYLNSQELNSL